MSGDQADIAGAGKKGNILPVWSWAVLVSAVAWALIFRAVPPWRQDFPLNDDWAFARGAMWFSQGQGIHYSRWASMPQLGQWLWSWPFLHLIQFPHVALRASVIVLSWLALVAFYDLLRLGGISERLAAFASCVLALNPLFFVSQGTYMTDVPALSFGLLALDFYCRALSEKKRRWLLGAATFALLAGITRQTMLSVPLAVVLPALRNRDMRLRAGWLCGVIAPAAACLCVGWWFSRRTDVLPMQLAIMPGQFFFRTFLALHLAGLAAVPLCLLLPLRKNLALFLSGFAIMLIVAWHYYLSHDDLPYGGLFPYCSGLISTRGICPDGLVLGSRDVLLSPPVRLAVTILGCAGAGGIMSALWEWKRGGKIFEALPMFTWLQFLFILTVPYVYDRYYEALFPGAILLVATQCSLAGIGRFAAIAAVMLGGLIAVMLFHDWLSWNSARWELGRQALSVNIQASDIEGGFEWDGWFASADPLLKAVPSAPIPVTDGTPLLVPFCHYIFPAVTGRYGLAFTQPTNSIVVATLPYSLWLPPAQKEFLFIQQKP